VINPIQSFTFDYNTCVLSYNTKAITKQIVLTVPSGNTNLIKIGIVRYYGLKISVKLEEQP